MSPNSKTSAIQRRCFVPHSHLVPCIEGCKQLLKTSVPLSEIDFKEFDAAFMWVAQLNGLSWAHAWQAAFDDSRLTCICCFWRLKALQSKTASHMHILQVKHVFLGMGQCAPTWLWYLYVCTYVRTKFVHHKCRIGRKNMNATQYIMCCNTKITYTYTLYDTVPKCSCKISRYPLFNLSSLSKLRIQPRWSWLLRRLPRQ